MASAQHESGMMVYPAGGWRKFFFRLPLFAWRSGWAFLLPRNFLILTTTGRKSGTARHTMVEHSIISGTIYLASGWGDRPQWVRNLEADANIVVQPVRGGLLRGRARRVTDAKEMAALYEPMRHSPVWESWLASWGIEPTVEDFVAKRDRMVVYAIDPADVPAPAPLKQDLRWLNGVLVLLALGLLRRKRQ
ncbi:MAG: nitroreductase family deazaflavin-dependent oxidoreductase [Anaerolineae bacterium]|nr:nitroreductase family deazaflavin-dependent oxidoreductase [Anaerolineae bacterium]